MITEQYVDYNIYFMYNFKNQEKRNAMQLLKHKNEFKVVIPAKQ